MRTKGITKGRILALVLLAIVLALPLLWMVQQKALREEEAMRRNSKAGAIRTPDGGGTAGHQEP